MDIRKKQIELIIDKVQDVVDLFYQQNNSEAFEKFGNIIEDMTNVVDMLAAYKNEHSEFEMDETKICGILNEAMEALEAGDTVLLADIMQYDFVEYINDLLINME